MSFFMARSPENTREYINREHISLVQVRGSKVHVYLLSGPTLVHEYPNQELADEAAQVLTRDRMESRR